MGVLTLIISATFAATATLDGIFSFDIFSQNSYSWYETYFINSIVEERLDS